MELIFKDEALTVSEKVRLRQPVFMSRENSTNSGEVLSSVMLNTCWGSSVVISCTGFPFISTISSDAMAI